MSFILENRTRSLGVKTSLAIAGIRITFSRVPVKQRLLPAQGITDVINGVLVQPISAKYPALALVRWRDITGAITGDEHTIDFADTHLFPPSDECNAFEIYVKQGSEYSVQVQEGGEVVDLQQYYTKAEVSALLANYRTKLESPTYEELQSDIYQVGDNFNYADYLVKTELKALQGFNYKQQAEPDSETVVVGETWRELDSSGNIVMDWIKDAAGWSSIRYSLAPIVITNALSATGIVYFPVDRSIGKAVYLKEFSLQYNYTGGSATNFWQVQFFQTPSGGTLHNALGSVIPLNKTNSGNWFLESGAINTQIPVASMGHLRLVLTKNASAGNISFSGYVKYHWKR